MGNYATQWANIGVIRRGSRRVNLKRSAFEKTGPVRWAVYVHSGARRAPGVTFSFGPAGILAAARSQPNLEGKSLKAPLPKYAFLIFFLPAILLPAQIVSAQSRPGENIQVDLELVLMVDVSGSVDDEEAHLQRDGYVNAVTSPQVLIAIRSGRHRRIAVSYVEWAGSSFQDTVIGWTLIDGEASARAFAGKLAALPPGRGPYTSISGAIDFALPLFNGNGFESPRRVIDVSGDGPNNSGRHVTAARDEAVAANVTINGLPIVNDRPGPSGRPTMPNLDLYYRKCVIGGPRSFIVVANDFKSFARVIRRKLILEIAGRPPADAAAPFGKRSIPVARRGTTPPCDIGERRRRERFGY